MARRELTLAGLRALEGQEIGTTGWHLLDQDTIAAFAATTGDTERIHLDAAAARAQGLGGIIAHGLLTLSLGPMFHQELLAVTDHSRVLNYGFEKVRFLEPVPVDSSIRMRLRLERVRPIEGGSAFHLDQAFELRYPDGTVAERPACVAGGVVAYFD
ncbi:MaoC family dehydratase [Citricoccus zhacaiensis]|uniref:MaoC family dehydratase n=1 Tax=Citricoccus zhacaiensis TaxID=489142 RepID=A0ABQ2LVE6_9MICC|nr:MaoC/PaaZ C-terminal domain-containing protein [Citricoccus zhacaiensis]GGO43641.1 MaoC family dehydratase [Citricoccus zhacaiensis]